MDPPRSGQLLSTSDNVIGPRAAPAPARPGSHPAAEHETAGPMTETWPPPGHNFTYLHEADIGGHHISFELTLPSAVPELNLATVRLGRIGGETGADQLFRARLYAAVGKITVAGGHADTAMKRLLALLTGVGRFSLVDETWSKLLRRLADQCPATTSDPRLKRLQHVLDWGETNRVKQRRDNAIHAYWWIYDGCSVTRSRFFHDQDGTLMIGSIDDLEEDA
jgi:hypothetical protein